MGSPHIWGEGPACNNNNKSSRARAHAIVGLLSDFKKMRWDAVRLVTYPSHLAGTAGVQHARRSTQRRPEGQLACRQGAAKNSILYAGPWWLRCAVVRPAHCKVATLLTCTIPKQYLSSPVFMTLGSAPAGSGVHGRPPTGAAASTVITQS